MRLCSCWKTVRVALLVHLLFPYICLHTSGARIIGPNGTNTIYGENATFFCQLTETDDQLTSITWNKKTQENSEETPFFSIRASDKTKHINGLGDRVQYIGNFAEKNGSIQLLRMRFLDEGIYTCIFKLLFSGPYETNIKATVFAHPVGNVKGEAPVSGYVEVTLASCFASNARPAAEVMWRVGDLQKYLRAETNHTVNSNGTVTVVSYLLGIPLKHLNKKNVQCVVKHKTLAEELVLNYSINIHYPPESVVILPDSPTNTKRFVCVADSNPDPYYTWTRDNKSTIYKGNSLPFPSSDLNGLYICKASNQYGSSLGSLYVHVHKECSTVCWSLFGLVCCVVLASAAAAAAIVKFKPEWIPVRRSDNEDPQERDL
ncbi:nectin-3 [Puntigrus tetrazona]|uniref:nectin-3 n=1 Tax=Puntigrus tetrazona TaxID=1606681 RepID=UPI001C8A6D81|nr:nectin-3 [Puntigrus tetrazona]